MNPAKSKDLLLRNVLTENGVRTVSYKQFLVRLNQYCDPIDTMYLGGNPLFDERTATYTPLEVYLADKGLGLDCQQLVD